MTFIQKISLFLLANLLGFLLSPLLKGQDLLSPEKSPLASLQHKALLSASFGNEAQSLHGAFFQLHPVGKKQRFFVGYGLRLNVFRGRNKAYTTAPAALIAAEKIDTLLLENPQIQSLNLALWTEYRPLPRLSLNFTIDVVGFGWGKKQKGAYNNPLFSPSLDASPAPFNLLLVGDNDLGTLHSEFGLAYQWQRNWAIRAGFAYLFTEYKTQENVAEQNNRFRYKHRAAFIGFIFTPFKK
ncbi:hypothetical protein [Hugenholtzia roseola]|uniref:hypothetical protein n=1 Tax=Hugenholtzia roseola TaxID=1002 RepID=UPI000419EBEB|nr:hypothetical protein [Hugenholtzia roseola]